MLCVERRVFKFRQAHAADWLSGGAAADGTADFDFLRLANFREWQMSKGATRRPND